MRLDTNCRANKLLLMWTNHLVHVIYIPVSVPPVVRGLFPGVLVPFPVGMSLHDNRK